MSKIWFSSDFHLGHNNIIQYCSRPYLDVEEMNRNLIDNWNSLVKEGDTCYLLGDLGFMTWGDLKPLIEELKGTIHVVLGNHDSKIRDVLIDTFNIASVSDLLEIKVAKQYITLCHYPMRSWNRSHYGSWNLHGHMHSSSPMELSEGLKRIDVGVDAWNGYPCSLNQIRELLIKQER